MSLEMAVDVSISQAALRRFNVWTLGSYWAAAASRLTSLTLRNKGSGDFDLRLHEDGLRGLPALRRVELCRCNLTDLPVALAAVRATMVDLGIRGNRAFTLSPASYSMLASMPLLRSFNAQFNYVKEEEVGAVWANRAVGRLVQER